MSFQNQELPPQNLMAFYKWVLKVRSIFKEFLNLSKSDRTLLLLRKDYSASSFAHSNERLTAFFQPL